MTAIETMVFDLDGTISDPKPGFVNSINHALVAHGFEARSSSTLAAHIGPPLDQSLADLTGQSDPEMISALVASYRQRYGAEGYRENILYDGVPETLALLKNAGIRLVVCSSKRADFVEKILVLFDLRGLFDYVSGGEVGIEKWQQLSGLIEDGVVDTEALMVGDRHFDLVAAHRNGLRSAGVLWGYGSHEELSAHEPLFLFSRVEELRSLVRSD